MYAGIQSDMKKQVRLSLKKHLSGMGSSRFRANVFSLFTEYAVSQKHSRTGADPLLPLVLLLIYVPNFTSK